MYLAKLNQFGLKLCLYAFKIKYKRYYRNEFVMTGERGSSPKGEIFGKVKPWALVYTLNEAVQKGKLSKGARV